MDKLVKCPVCNTTKRTRGTKYFQCDKCRLAIAIDKALVPNVDEYRYNKKENDGNIELVCDACGKNIETCDCIEATIVD